MRQPRLVIYDTAKQNACEVLPDAITGSVFFIRDNIAAAEYVQYICYN